MIQGVNAAATAADVEARIDRLASSLGRDESSTSAARRSSDALNSQAETSSRRASSAGMEQSRTSAAVPVPRRLNQASQHESMMA